MVRVLLAGVFGYALWWGITRLTMKVRNKFNTRDLSGTQSPGLSENAKKMISTYTSHQYDVVKNIDRTIPLHKYIEEDGTCYFENVQTVEELKEQNCKIVFLALFDENGNIVKESIWEDADLGNYCEKIYRRFKAGK